jgi:hypothetical protein
MVTRTERNVGEKRRRSDRVVPSEWCSCSQEGFAFHDATFRDCGGTPVFLDKSAEEEERDGDRGNPENG